MGKLSSYGVGGECHGGSVSEKGQRGTTVKIPFPKDCSDFDGGAKERGKSMKTVASGAAGGYPGSTDE